MTKEQGFILEMIWRQPHFYAMKRWNFDDPKIIEYKYEDLINNEKKIFEEIFNHYGFHEKVVSRGLEIVENLSLKNRSKGSQKHVRKGTKKQYKNEFTPLVSAIFWKLYGDLLVKLGYEKDRIQNSNNKIYCNSQKLKNNQNIVSKQKYEYLNLVQCNLEKQRLTLQKHKQDLKQFKY